MTRGMQRRMLRKVRPEIYFKLPRIEVDARVPAVHVLRGRIYLGAESIRPGLHPRHHRVEEALDGARGSGKERKVGLPGLDYSARSDLRHKDAQILYQPRPRKAASTRVDRGIQECK